MKKNKKISKRQKIQETGFYDDVPLLFMEPEDFDDAIIGVIDGKAHEPAVAYDYNKVIKVNMKMGMNMDEAVEYFGFNQVDAYVGKHTPVFINIIK